MFLYKGKGDFDTRALQKTLSLYPSLTSEVTALEYLNGKNQVWYDGEGNFNLLTWNGEGVYTAHYFFPTKRGRAALDMVKAGLKAVFVDNDEIQVLRGLTPVTQRGAIWMNRQLGFKSYGTVEDGERSYEIFILTKKEYLGE